MPPIPKSESRKALILGATGAVGGPLLTELLASDEYDSVCEAGRKVTPPEAIGAIGKDKLVQKVIDFEKLSEAGLDEGYNAIYITLGTSKAAAGSAAAFEKIDREYVVNAAKAAKTTGAGQRLVYLSSTGASASSPFLYPRSKGLTENALAHLGYEDTIIFRPGLLVGRGEKTRTVEKVSGYLTGFLTKFGNDYEIPVDTLAKSMLRAGILGSKALPSTSLAETVNVPKDVKFTVLANRGASNLGTMDS